MAAAGRREARRNMQGPARLAAGPALRLWDTHPTKLCDYKRSLTNRVVTRRETSAD